MQILRLTLLNLKRMIANKNVLFLTLLMPMVVMCIVTFFNRGSENTSSSDKIYIDFVNKDKGNLGQELIKEFQSSGNFSVYTTSKEEAEYRVSHNVTSEAVIIPEKFSESIEKGADPNISILKLNIGNVTLTADSKINYFINERIISKEIASSLKGKTTEAKDISMEISKETALNKVTTSSKTVVKDNKNSLGNQMTINLCVSFMMFTVLFIVNEIIARRDDKTLKRSFTAPNSKFAIMASFVVAFLLIGWLQVILMVGSTSILFKVNWGNSILALFVFFTVLILVVLGLGVLLSRIVRTASNAAMVCQMVVQISCMVGGSYMPLEYFPDFLKRIAYFVPQSWAVSALTDVVIENKGLISILPDIGILLLFAAAFFTAGVSTIREIAE